MRKVLLLLLVAGVLLASCSEYNKAMKASGEGAIQLKMATAEKYYAIGVAGLAPGASGKAKRKSSGGFERALPLLEELIALTRGDTMFERVSYMYAKSQYGIKDYILAGYYLEHFVKTFPASVHAEECSFLSAICHYRESPEHELDQAATTTAINQFQLFLARYPETTLTDSCNALIDQLRRKLEEKDHVNAMQYLKIRHYEAAGLALRSFLKKWPNSRHREDVLYNIIVADHAFAVNSMPTRRPMRAEIAMKSYQGLEDAFPESPLKKKGLELRKDLDSRMERFLYEALEASHAAATTPTNSGRGLALEDGLRFFDTFAARFPESRFMPEAIRLRDELTRIKQTPSSQKKP